MSGLVVVGAGGNIGSNLTAHLARIPGVTSMKLIDRDTYEQSNLRSQNVNASAVGKSKAAVQATSVRRVNPALSIEPIHAAVEDLPLGALRGDVILACLDSRRARMVVNQAARRLGVAWIDAGVSGDDLLARIQVFAADPAAACMECGWSDDDYLVVEQKYPCQAAAGPAPTSAPSGLGALAAAIQAIECEKFLAGSSADLLVNRELLISARHHRHFVTSSRRNPACRMPDHDAWPIVRGSLSIRHTVREALALGARLPDAERHLAFGVAGQSLMLTIICPDCGRSKSVLKLERMVRLNPTRCWRCRRPMAPAGFDLYDTVSARSIPPAKLNQRLSRLGLRPGDVLTLSTPGGLTHHEIGGLS